MKVDLKILSGVLFFSLIAIGVIIRALDGSGQGGGFTSVGSRAGGSSARPRCDGNEC